MQQKHAVRLEPGVIRAVIGYVQALTHLPDAVASLADPRAPLGLGNHRGLAVRSLLALAPAEPVLHERVDPRAALALPCNSVPFRISRGRASPDLG